MAILRVLDAAAGGRGVSPGHHHHRTEVTPQAMAARLGDREAHAYLHLMPGQIALSFIGALAICLVNDPRPDLAEGPVVRL